MKYMTSKEIWLSDAYAASLKDKNELMESQSGGAFFAFAKHILQSGGVCYGACMEDDYTVHHIRIDRLSEINKIRKSKYVQSRVGESFLQAKNDLDNGLTVLFSGTPCQIAGLYCFLEKDYTNLLLVEVVCHGIPSNKMFLDHIHYLESVHKKALAQFEFRCKKRGWIPPEVKYVFSDGEIIFPGYNNDAYIHLFNKYVSLRKACSECCFRGDDSYSDITICDYWGISKQHPGFCKDNLGISGIIVKSEKGKELYNRVSSELDAIESSVHNISVMNPWVVNNPGYRLIRDEFFSDYIKYKKTHSIVDLNEIYQITLARIRTRGFDVLGSFSLNWICNLMLKGDERYYIGNYYTGSNLSSVCTVPVNSRLYMNYNSKNEYRQNCIDFDWNKKIHQKLSRLEKGDSVLVLDLLDERLGCALMDDTRLAVSEACQDAIEEGGITVDSIVEAPDIPEEWWKSGCDGLITELKKYYLTDRIIVVKTFLCEKSGNEDNVLDYINVENIKMINDSIRKKYDYLISELPGCRVIDMSTCEKCYTPIDYRHGCKPEYYDDATYWKMSQKLLSMLGEMKWS